MSAETQVKTYRVAVPGDEAAILNIFAEVAPEVPTAVRPQTEGIIKELVATGNSWVAIDADDKIVGYALAAMDTNTLSLVLSGRFQNSAESARLLLPHIEIERRRRANNHGRPF